MPMDPVTKIGTCCYCGSRAMLTLQGDSRHELACSSCGAPLHNMKQIKREPAPAPLHPSHPGPTAARSPVRKKSKTKPQKPQKKAKKRGWGYFARELFDEIEDLFD